MYKQMNLEPFVFCVVIPNEILYLSGFFVQWVPVWQLRQFPVIVFASAFTLNLICAGCRNGRKLQ